MSHFLNRLRTHLRTWFLPAQAIVVGAFLGVPWYQSRLTESGPRLPQFDPVPIVVQPEYDEPLVVTDEQLQLVLTKLQPRLRKAQPKINYVDHALRFWGLNAKFQDPDTLTGVRMREILTSHKAFAQVWGEKTKPLMSLQPSGIAVKVQQGESTTSHVDHTLATLAEVGTPLDYPIETADGLSRLRNMLERALLTFDINQQEYEWTTLAWALYAVDGKPWYTAEGDRIDFDRLADRLIRQQYQQGVCYGNHRLFTLALLLRVDDAKQLLTPAARQRIIAHLRDATERLVRSQSPEGYWDQNWPNTELEAKDAILDGALPRRLLATGHALEWWAVAPRELHPPRESLVRAGQWLVKEVDNLDSASVTKNYTFLTHVGRALALWRGHFPADWIAQHPLPPSDRASADAPPTTKDDVGAGLEKPLVDDPGRAENQ